MKNKVYYQRGIIYLKNIAKSLLPNRLTYFIKNIKDVPTRLDENEKNVQTLTNFLLKEKYEPIADKRFSSKPEVNNYEFKISSQHGEDGILLYLFSKIGVTNRCFVEFGVGDGKECNTANLAINFGWHGLLMEASEKKVAIAKKYYRNVLGNRYDRVKVIQCFVTVDNINDILVENHILENIDLLSIDIDSNDYWVWKAISVIKPRVVVIEYNASFGDDKSLTIKYDPNFRKSDTFPFGLYHGASLAALTKLANSKGYILVGCNSHGVNAFFVRKDVAKGKIQEVSVRDAYFPNVGRTKRLTVSEQFECIKKFDYVDI